MRFSNQLKNWASISGENYWSRLFASVLAFAVLALALNLFNKDQIVVIKPFTLTEEAWVSQSDGSEVYKESWAMAIAQIVGNVTPSSVPFVKEAVSPLLSPDIYQEVIDVIDAQALLIAEDRITLTFSPHTIETEKETSKVFVTGKSTSRSGNADSKATQKTFEFIIEINNYLPIFSYISSYDGQPRTLKVLETMKKKALLEKQRELEY